MSPQQIKQAEEDAKSDAKYLALLLLLALANKDSISASRVKWNESTGKFLVDNKVVSVVTLRLYLSRIETKLGRRLLKLTDDLAAKKITLGAWQREFERTITISQILAGALAVGGIAAAVKNTMVLDRIDEQISFADGLTTEIRTNKAGSMSKIRARVKSYLQAAHITFENVQQDFITTTGIYDECKRVLRAKESCSCCVLWAEKGFVPVEDQPPIGRFDFPCCWIFDKCYLVYRKAPSE